MNSGKITSGIQNAVDGGWKLSNDQILVYGKAGNLISSYPKSYLKDGTKITFFNGKPVIVPDPMAKYSWNQSGAGKSSGTGEIAVVVDNAGGTFTPVDQIEPVLLPNVDSNPIDVDKNIKKVKVQPQLIDPYKSGYVPDGGGNSSQFITSMDITENIVLASIGALIGGVIGYYIADDNYFVIVGCAAIGTVGTVLLGKNLISKIP